MTDHGIFGYYPFGLFILLPFHLDGNQSMDAMEQALTSLHAQVLDKIASYRHGIIAAVGISPSDVTFVQTGSPGLPNLVLKFKPGTFKPGDSLSFALDQDLAKTGTFGGSSDSLKAGATFAATVKGTP